MNLAHNLSSLERLDGHVLFQAFYGSRNDELSYDIGAKITIHVESMSPLTTTAALSATVISADDDSGLYNPHSNQRNANF